MMTLKSVVKGFALVFCFPPISSIPTFPQAGRGALTGSASPSTSGWVWLEMVEGPLLCM